MSPVNKKSGIRLDKFLSQKFPAYSRVFLKQQIKQGNILVNGKPRKPSYILKKDDKVDIKINSPEKQSLKPNKDIKLDIIYEDNDVIVIDKPAGIATHPARLDCYDTIANALLAYYPPIKDVGDMPEIRPGIVHRLDKDTSGLMVVAKNNSAYNWLKKQFVGRKVEKKYTALVIGAIRQKQGIITKSISKAKGSIKRTIAPRKGARKAVTHYKTIKLYCHPELPAVIPAQTGIQWDNENNYKKLDPRLRGDDKKIPARKQKTTYTFLEAYPKTGRTHQIRVHLASIGHPIAGDKLYSFKGQTTPSELKRHFLHASYLKLSLPNGKIVELQSELPADLRQALQTLESKSLNSY